MRSLYPAVLLVLAACSSEAIEAAPDASPVAIDAGSDAAKVAVIPRDAAPEASAEAGVDAGPLDPACNGNVRRDDCAALFLPSAYGMNPGCEGTPYRGTSERRPSGLVGCVDYEVLATHDRLTCCPE